MRPLSLHWLPATLVGRFPAAIRPWLQDRGSLTQKLKQQCPHFSVQRLFEGFALPLPSEAQKLNLSSQTQVWTRIVLLMCDQQPVVYARTLIPHLTPANPWQRIQNLGNQPLGELLFELPHLHRSEFEFTQTQACWPACPNALSQTLTYARRNLFLQQSHPLLLTEVFLTLHKTAFPTARSDWDPLPESGLYPEK